VVRKKRIGYDDNAVQAPNNYEILNEAFCPNCVSILLWTCPYKLLFLWGIAEVSLLTLKNTRKSFVLVLAQTVTIK